MPIENLQQSVSIIIQHYYVPYSEFNTFSWSASYFYWLIYCFNITIETPTYLFLLLVINHKCLNKLATTAFKYAFSWFRVTFLFMWLVNWNVFSFSYLSCGSKSYCITILFHFIHTNTFRCLEYKWCISLATNKIKTVII